MDIKELLPIGSVVGVKQGTKKLMIIGIGQSLVLDDGNKVPYDYLGIPYPEGDMGPEYQFMFHHEDIDQIVWFGCMDEEHESFIDSYTEYIEKNKDQEGNS